MPLDTFAGAKVFCFFFSKKKCFLLLALSSCATAHPTCAPPPTSPVVWVLSRGWHTQFGLSAGDLTGGLAIFRQIYPGLRAIMFGYGKRTFMTARADRASEYLLGPFPGPAVIETVGLQTLPPAAYGTDGMVALKMPPGGAAALSAFIWNDMARDHAGEPRLVGPGRYAGSRFYDAVSGYNLAHTCNTWIADALNAAGVPVRAGGVVFSGQLMSRAERAAALQCPAPAARQWHGGDEPSAHTTRAPGGSTTAFRGADPPPPKLELHAASPTDRLTNTTVATAGRQN